MLRSLAHRARAGSLLALVLAGAACAPRARPLTGIAAPAARVPAGALPPGHHHVVFRWRYEDADMNARGEGVARIAAPDSARMDFFVDPGMGAGYALLVGDRLDAPGISLVRRYLPPPPLLWASLGRLRVPAAADTVARVDGDTIRADIGRAPVWRVTFAGERLIRLERIDDGRVVERVVRAGDDVRYEHLGARRSLALTVTRRTEAPPFDESIWRP
jgi:hypothetical protein